MRSQWYLIGTATSTSTGAETLILCEQALFEKRMTRDIAKLRPRRVPGTIWRFQHGLPGGAYNFHVKNTLMARFWSGGLARPIWSDRNPHIHCESGRRDLSGGYRHAARPIKRYDPDPTWKPVN